MNNAPRYILIGDDAFSMLEEKFQDESGMFKIGYKVICSGPKSKIDTFLKENKIKESLVKRI